MQERVSSWVRAGMVVLAVPQLAIGIWAMVAPHHWYENFPGVHPHLIAAEPPFNEHLATDAGIGFFATGLGLALGAALARRSGVYVALVTFLAFAGPHTLYHALHEAPGLTSSEDVSEVLFLLSAVVLGGVLLWGAARHGPDDIPSVASESFVHSARDSAGL